MQIIDTHTHVWTHDPEYPLAPETVRLPPNDASPESLLDTMARHGVDRAVLVHHIAYGWDNSYAFHIRNSFPSKFMAVCRVNPEDIQAPDQLSYLTEVQGFHGVRLSPDPAKRGDWFADALMVPLFRRANELKVPVLLLTQPSRLVDLASILDSVPDTCLVLDHMADTFNGTAHDLEQLLALAQYPHVYLKMSHILINSAQGHLKRDTRGFLKQVYDTYGASRMMWGSDWPLCLNHTVYAQVMAYARGEMDFLTAEDLEWIYGKTALQIWPFSDEKTISSQDVS